MGAGGGGYLLLYCHTHRQQQVRKALEATGGQFMNFSFDHEGLQVWRTLRVMGKKSNNRLPVAVLAGGAGKRLRPVVANFAKMLVPINDRPFLFILLDQLIAGGADHFVLCAGYLGDQIRAAADGQCGERPVIHSHEEQPLGTGGALPRRVQNAARFGTVEVNDATGRYFRAVHRPSSSEVGVELVSVLSRHFSRRALGVIALTTDSSILRASANDFGFAGVLERQVQALGRPGDVLLAISTSGNSGNVICAIVCCRNIGMRGIALTGAGGGSLAAEELAICCPDTNVKHVQEVHITIGYIFCALWNAASSRNKRS